MISRSKSTNLEYFDFFDSPNALKENSFYIKALSMAVSSAALCLQGRNLTSKHLRRQQWLHMEAAAGEGNRPSAHSSHTGCNWTEHSRWVLPPPAEFCLWKKKKGSKNIKFWCE